MPGINRLDVTCWILEALVPEVICDELAVKIKRHTGGVMDVYTGYGCNPMVESFVYTFNPVPKRTYEESLFGERPVSPQIESRS